MLCDQHRAFRGFLLVVMGECCFYDAVDLTRSGAGSPFLSRRRTETAPTRLFHDNLCEDVWEDSWEGRMNFVINDSFDTNCPPSGEMNSPHLRRYMALAVIHYSGAPCALQLRRIHPVK